MDSVLCNHILSSWGHIQAHTPVLSDRVTLKIIHDRKTRPSEQSAEKRRVSVCKHVLLTWSLLPTPIKNSLTSMGKQDLALWWRGLAWFIHHTHISTSISSSVTWQVTTLRAPLPVPQTTGRAIFWLLVLQAFHRHIWDLHECVAGFTGAAVSQGTDGVSCAGLHSHCMSVTS